MYDYPLSSSSSSTPPSPVRKHLHRRSQSPLPHLATLLPTGAHHKDHYSPSTRAADISRLLDPAYASTSSSSSMSATPPPHAQTRAYVDNNGDLHDPDYRDFPVLRQTSRAYPTGKRRRTSTGSANAVRSASHDRFPLGVHPTRPGWERGWDDGSDAEDVDDDAESQSHFSPFSSQTASTRRAASHGAFGFAPYHPPAYYYYSDAPHSSSPVGSLEEEQETTNALQLHESPFGEDDEAEEVIEDVRPRSTCLIRNASKPKKNASKVTREKVSVSEEAPSPSTSPFDENDIDVHASTPTCTHVLRQQWQAMTLRIRFTVFHAKRRLARRRRT
ncbi:hypothetical protein BN946_scf184996.g74 [Trametes cinnabarina]|uniref:Uncharacterized protein n=1 Tax=Pycnoporus cinnabarinus TaxID=5643 RepID=A0A060S8D7_PYCCI|nr:hypothetical protein BN946_scf184996.g74 [Trametes cinnabarina]